MTVVLVARSFREDIRWSIPSRLQSRECRMDVVEGTMTTIEQGSSKRDSEQRAYFSTLDHRTLNVFFRAACFVSRRRQKTMPKTSRQH
jgi:hypothetical protein